MAEIFEDQLVPDCIPATSVPLPKYWEYQNDGVQTFKLSTNSEEWRICEKLITKSLQVIITKFTRLQNMWLCKAYNFNKARMNRRNLGTINKMDLFHGSSSKHPLEIVCGKDGFDIRHSKGGTWGHAIYLSNSAQYSDKFAHCTASGERIIIIAKALIGESYDAGTDRQKELRMPPVQQRSVQNMLSIMYDSVSGITQTCRVYMLYNNDRAYPVYILKYKYMLSS